MKKAQIPVLIMAGITMVLLFGMGDIMDTLQNKQTYTGPLSIKERNEIRQKLNIQELVTNRRIPGDQFEKQINSYHDMLKKVDQAGIQVANEELQEYIVKQFGSKTKYIQVIAFLEGREGIKAGELEEWFRDSLKFVKLSQLSALAAYVTQKELEDAYLVQNKKVEYDQFDVDSGSLVMGDDLKEEDLKKHYESNKHKSDYEEPEQVQLEVLYLDYAKIKTTDPGENELRDYYNQNRKRYASREYPGEAEPYFAVKEQLQQDLVDQEQKTQANHVMNELDDILLDQDTPDLKATLEKAKTMGPLFEQVVHAPTEAFSQSDYRIEPLGLVFDLSREVFKEERKNYGGVLESDKCSYLYQVLATTPTRTLSFEEARKTVEKEHLAGLKLDKAKAICEEWTSKLGNTSDWGTLKLAQNSGYINISIEEQKTYVSDIAAAAEKLSHGEVSKPIKTNSGFTVVRLRKVIPAELTALAAEKDSLKQSLLREKMQTIQLAEIAELDR